MVPKVTTMNEILKVCIVEDNPDATEKLTLYLGEYGKKRGYEFSVEHYNDPLDFLEEFRGNYEFIFMDIELPHLDGMETTRRIRQIDKRVIVIFVTNMAQYAVKGYEVDALDFIVKPVQYPSFCVKLDRAVERFKSLRDKEIWISERGNLRRLFISQIKYVEVVHHTVIWHTTEGNYKTYGQMKSATDLLGESPFSLCNRCYLVNLRFVTAIEEMSVVVGGETLQISRNKRKDFLQDLNDFLGGK